MGRSAHWFCVAPVVRWWSVETKDLQRWFDEGELEQCPRCSQHTALQTPKGGFILCFDCGIVGVRAGHEDGGPIRDVHTPTDRPTSGS